MPALETSSPAVAERENAPVETLIMFDDGSVNSVWRGNGARYDFSANRTYGGLGGPDVTGITVRHYDEYGTRSRFVFIDHSMVRFDTDEKGRTTSHFTRNAFDVQRSLKSAPITIGGASARFGNSKVEEIYALRALEGGGPLGREPEKATKGKANPLMVALDIYADKLGLDR